MWLQQDLYWPVSLSSQPPRLLPALTTLAALESSIRLIRGLRLALALLQAAGPCHQETSGSYFLQSQNQGYGYGTDIAVLPLSFAWLSHPTASSELLGWDGEGAPCFLWTDQTWLGWEAVLLATICLSPPVHQVPSLLPLPSTLPASLAQACQK